MNKYNTMESKKNTAPKTVIIAILLFAFMIIVYFVLAAYFPELLDKMNLGEAEPIK